MNSFKTRYPEKYDQLIDTETWAFIRETESWYPSDPLEKPIQEQRETYNNMCRAFSVGYPAGVSAMDGLVISKGHNIPVRRYNMQGSGRAAEVVYYHGGGYVVGGLDSHDDVCAEICASTGYSVTSVDYRLAPENMFPADFDDAVAVFKTVKASTSLPLILVGDSAGGNLAAAVSHAMRDWKASPTGQVLIYPGLGSEMTQGSFIEHAEAPLLTTQDTIYYTTIRTGQDDGLLSNPECSPLEDTDFSDLPPTIVFSAQCDPLKDDGSNYCAALTRESSQALFVEEKGLVHGYLRARHQVGRARVSFAKILTAIHMLGRQEWPGNLANLPGK